MKRHHSIEVIFVTFIIVAGLAVWVLPVGSALATDYVWDAGDGWWNGESNWDPAGTPTSADVAYIDNGGTATVAATAEAYDTHVGYHNPGALVQTGGTYDIADGLYLAGYAASTGLYGLHGGELNVGDLVRLGTVGTGSFTQTGGTHNVLGSMLALGAGNSATGVYDLQDGLLSVTLDVEVGQNGTGIFNQSGGTHSIGDELRLGKSIGGSGLYDLQNGMLTVAGYAKVGEAGTGSFTQTAGTLSVGDSVYLGYNAGSTGSFTQTGGTHTSGWLSMGHNSGATGAYDLQEGQLTLSGATIGTEGTGSFTQSGGTHSVINSLIMGSSQIFGDDSGTGVYELSGGQLMVGDDTSVGSSRNATGTFIQTGGTHSVGSVLYLGRGAGSVGTYDLQGGVLSVTTIRDGEGSWAFNFTGGTLRAGTVEFDLTNDGGVLAPGEFGDTNIRGRYTQNAGTLEIELASLAGFGRLDVWGSAGLGGSLNVLGLTGYRPMEGDSFPIISAWGELDGDFSEIISNITAGIPEGLPAFSGRANGGAYQVTFNGLTAGDANGDHRASIGDLALMAGNWNQAVTGGYGDADFNGDGIVSIGDLSMLAGNWGWELPGTSAIPEPATLALLAFGGLAVLRRSCRKGEM